MTDEGSGSPPLPSGSVQVQPVAARVSESASRGVFSTGVVLLTGGNEFIVDFVQNLGSPTSVVSRVIIPHGAMARIIDAIERNVEGYEDRFGPIPDGIGEVASEAGGPDNPRDTQDQAQDQEQVQGQGIAPEDLTNEQLVGIGQIASAGTTESPEPNAQDIYDDIRLELDVEAGVYANALMIGHSASEFKLDFIANLYPKSIVTTRVYLSAPHLMRVLASMKRTYSQFIARRNAS
ncbi:MAG: DUF3467 domain-containing protein [Pirellulales bacterium]|nr:DUF3467 domain-containing protein [Pirellulales bacterium]